MKPSDVPEMKSYLERVKRETDCKMLFYAETMELGKNAADTCGLDWADLRGTEVLHEYWLLATTPERQVQLGKVCHLRAKAWDAVMTECFIET
jgi:hypothetical protein